MCWCISVHLKSLPLKYSMVAKGHGSNHSLAPKTCRGRLKDLFKRGAEVMAGFVMRPCAWFTRTTNHSRRKPSTPAIREGLISHSLSFLLFSTLVSLLKFQNVNDSALTAKFGNERVAWQAPPFPRPPTEHPAQCRLAVELGFREWNRRGIRIFVTL